MTGVRSSMDSMAVDSKSSRFLLGSTLIGKKIERLGSLVSIEAGEQVVSKQTYLNRLIRAHSAFMTRQQTNSFIKNYLITCQQVQLI